EVWAADGTVRLELSGEWDVSNAPALVAALRPAGDGVARVLVDLEHAVFIDAVVIGCLVRAQEACVARGASLQVVRAHGEPLRAIQLCGRTGLVLGLAGPPGR